MKFNTYIDDTLLGHLQLGHVGDLGNLNSQSQKSENVFENRMGSKEPLRNELSGGCGYSQTFVHLVVE